MYVYRHALSVMFNSAMPWTVALQAPLSMEFSRQEYWRALPFPPPGDLPDPGIKPKFLASPALAGRFFTTTAFETIEIPERTKQQQHFFKCINNLTVLKLERQVSGNHVFAKWCTMVMPLQTAKKYLPSFVSFMKN